MLPPFDQNVWMNLLQLYTTPHCLMCNLHSQPSDQIHWLHAFTQRFLLRCSIINIVETSCHTNEEASSSATGQKTWQFRCCQNSSNVITLTSKFLSWLRSSLMRAVFADFEHGQMDVRKMKIAQLEEQTLEANSNCSQSCMLSFSCA